MKGEMILAFSLLALISEVLMTDFSKELPPTCDEHFLYYLKTNVWNYHGIPSKLLGEYRKGSVVLYTGEYFHSNISKAEHTINCNGTFTLKEWNDCGESSFYAINVTEGEGYLYYSAYNVWFYGLRFEQNVACWYRCSKDGGGGKHQLVLDVAQGQCYNGAIVKDCIKHFAAIGAYPETVFDRYCDYE